MKENAIRKINITGKVAYIISIVLRVAVGIGALLLLIATIALRSLPEDFIKMNFGGDVRVSVDTSSIGEPMTPQDAADVEKVFDELNANGTLSIGDTGMESLEASVDGDIINVLAHKAGDGYVSLKTFSSITLVGFLTCIATFVALTFIGIFFNRLKNCQTPFEDNVITSLRNAAFSLIPFAFLSSLTNSISNAIVSGNYHISFTLDFAVVVVILLILALTFIFKYGAMLQQESDETL